MKNMTPTPPSIDDANPSDNINSNTNDVSHRAKSHWNFVKSLHATQKSSQNQLFKSGDNISLTTAEATFLNMITKSKLDDDHDKVVKSSFNSGSDKSSMSGADKEATDTQDEISGSSRQRGTSQFTHLVQAAVAKERLRTAISDRLSELPDNEVKFLTKLVNNKSVSLEALENTVHVLNNDPLYNPNLIKDEDDEEDDIEDRRGNMRRQASEHSSKHFEKLMDKSEKIKAIPARRLNRKTSVAESSVWKLATAADDNIDDKMNEEETLSNSRTFRRASIHEKNMFNLVRGESIKMVNSDVLKELEALEDDDGLPVKSTKRGDTMDPLCMAVPMEETPRITHKTLPSLKDEDEKMSLELDMESNKASINDSFVAGDQTEEDVTPSIIACCGANMSIFNMLKEPSNEENEDINPISSESSFDKDSLESKKQFLHLEHERQAHLTTWMGKPEDYPILGLGKKQKSKQNKSKSIAAIDEEEDVDDDDSGEIDNTDPLEPHVLSPLLMKCMREHLPYALREENFWLKYSLARDGASLEAIYSIMRHSSHTVLAIETTTGEVFGSFTSSPWRPNGNSYYGSCEAFVWQLRKTRQDSCNSLDEYILRESSLEVFKWNHDGNRNVQLSNTKKLFVGGGNPDVDDEEDVMMQDTNENIKDTDEEVWGMSIALDKELLNGTSSRCATFASNPLNRNSEVFEIMNCEIWALTPCMNEESAEELELGRTFVMGGTSKC